MKSILTKSFIAAGVLALSGAAASASTTNIDFESFALGTDIAGLDFSGLTFSQNGAAMNVSSFSPGNTGNTILTTGTNTADPFQGMFSITGVTSFSVDIGDQNADPDDLFLRAYDSSDNLIASDAISIAATFVGVETLSVMTLVDIARVEFGGVGLGGNNNVIFDNVSFTTAAVPLPAAGLLMLGGLGAFGALRRRKKA